MRPVNQYLTKISLALVLLSGPAFAQTYDDTVLSGAWEYADACAACHGSDGTGGGALAAALKTAPPDLTRLAEQNGGEFPFERVFRIIDGRTPVEGHGSAEMPVWGQVFGQEARDDPSRPMTSTAAAGRIYALARYLRAIQGGNKVPLVEKRRPRRSWPDEYPRPSRR